MNVDEVAHLLRLVGLPLMMFGLFALISWNARCRPKDQEPRSVVRAIKSADQPGPPPLVLGSFVLGTISVLVSSVFALLN
jgi:hypothetical protein